MALPDSVYVHPQALCESETVGAETRIWAFAHVMQGAQIGAGCNVCDHVFVEAGAVIGDRVIIKNNVMVWDKVVVEDDVFLGPNAVLTNDMIPRAAFKNPPEKFLPTRIGKGASVGANATVVCGVTLGRGCFVGAGSVVIRDVPAFAMVVGNPARRVGWICACGGRLPEDLCCPQCPRSYVADGDGLRLLSEP